MSPYALRLLEKQKLRFNYNITERQLLRYVIPRSQQVLGEVLLELEMRFDRHCLSVLEWHRQLAAQSVSRTRSYLVNQAKVDIPSYSCSVKDIISIKIKKLQEI
jgi:small subunit ribosomal protein S4